MTKLDWNAFTYARKGFSVDHTILAFYIKQVRNVTHYCLVYDEHCKLIEDLILNKRNQRTYSPSFINLKGLRMDMFYHTPFFPRSFSSCIPQSVTGKTGTFLFSLSVNGLFQWWFVVQTMLDELKIVAHCLYRLCNALIHLSSKFHSMTSLKKWAAICSGFTQAVLLQQEQFHVTGKSHRRTSEQITTWYFYE